MIKKAFIYLSNEIVNHPKTASVLGAVQAFVLGLIDIQTSTVWLRFIGELFKTLGIIAGSLVAMYGFYKTFLKKEKIG